MCCVVQTFFKKGKLLKRCVHRCQRHADTKTWTFLWRNFAKSSCLATEYSWTSSIASTRSKEKLLNIECPRIFSYLVDLLVVTPKWKLITAIKEVQLYLKLGEFFLYLTQCRFLKRKFLTTCPILNHNTPVDAKFLILWLFCCQDCCSWNFAPRFNCCERISLFMTWTQTSRCKNLFLECCTRDCDYSCTLLLEFWIITLFLLTNLIDANSTDSCYKSFPW